MAGSWVKNDILSPEISSFYLFTSYGIIYSVNANCSLSQIIFVTC